MTTQVSRQLEYLLPWSRWWWHNSPFLSIGCRCHQEHHPCLVDNLDNASHYLTFPWRAILGQRPESHDDIFTPVCRWVKEIYLQVRTELHQFSTLPGHSEPVHRERRTSLTWMVTVRTSYVKNYLLRSTIELVPLDFPHVLQGRNFPENPEVHMFTITGNEPQRASLMDHLCFIFGFVFIRCNAELSHGPSRELHNLSF